jgi:hypothetical protein
MVGSDGVPSDEAHLFLNPPSLSARLDETATSSTLMMSVLSQRLGMSLERNPMFKEPS